MMRKNTKPDIADRTPKRHGINRISAMTRALLKPMMDHYGEAYVGILLDWPTIVGERYAKLTAVQYLKFPKDKKTDGILYIRCVSAAMPIMQAQSPQLIERLNRYFGYKAIVSIRLQAGLVFDASSRKKPTYEHPLSEEAHQTINALTTDIANDELRLALQRLGEGILKENERVSF